jgi:hypothetical protein
VEGKAFLKSAQGGGGWMSESRGMRGLRVAV